MWHQVDYFLSKKTLKTFQMFISDHHIDIIMMHGFDYYITIDFIQQNLKRYILLQDVQKPTDVKSFMD